MFKIEIHKPAGQNLKRSSSCTLKEYIWFTSLAYNFTLLNVSDYSFCSRHFSPNQDSID